MDYNTLLSKRLKIILNEQFGGNYSAMSRLMGVTDGALGSYIRGKKQKDGSIRISTPSAEVIANIINNLGINSEWLLFGTGDMKVKQTTNVVSEPEQEYILSQNRLLAIIESQQRVIESQSKCIEILSDGGNGTAEGANTARVRKGS